MRHGVDLRPALPSASGGVTLDKSKGSRFVVALVAVAAATFLLGVASTSAQSGDEYTFSGTVSSDEGSLAGITVSVFCVGCEDGSHTDPESDPARPWPAGAKLLGEDVSDVSGNWSVTVGAPSEGRPHVFAWDSAGDYGFAQERIGWYWRDATDLDLRMSDGGVLSGRILGDGPVPASDDVRYSLGDRANYPDVVLGLIVGAGGEYVTPGLPNGSYYVSYEGLPESYVSDGYSLLGEISDGQNAVADHELVQYGTVSGRVTDGSGTGLGGIIVSFSTPEGGYYVSDGSGRGLGGVSASTSTPDGGYYAPGGRAMRTDDTGFFGTLYSWPSELLFSFRDPLGVYAPVSETISVASKEAVDLSVQMVLAGSIEGRVVDWEGLPVEGTSTSVCLLLDNNEVNCYLEGSNVWNEPDGTYRATTLRPATYQVQANVWRASLEVKSEPIVVAEGTSHEVDLVFDRGGKISGVVTDVSGAPVAGLEVGFRGAGSATTGSDGSYVSQLLAAGDYTLSFARAFSFSMDPVSVQDGTTTSGVDVTLDVGYIEGRVTSGGEPLPDATVGHSGPLRGSASTGANGSYRIALAPGSYTVSFSTPWHVSARHQNSIDVVGGATVSGIDADLAEQPGAGPPMRPPDGTEVTGASSTLGGIPSFARGDTVTLEHRGCPNGSAYLYLFNRRHNMSETPAGSGLYTAAVTVAAVWQVGLVNVSISVDCDDYDENSYVEFNIYIDPSGVVQDQNGNPIAGATVTLLRDNPATLIRDFEAVADGSVLMDPAVNNTNPDVTGDDGRFRWDVVRGLWKVRATAPGCHAPGASSTAFVETAELEVPPPRLGLVLELECAAAGDDSFTDVSGVHSRSVEALQAEGVLDGTGCGPGRFCPGDEMRRWTMAVWLVRVLDDSDPGPVTTTRFADVDPNEWWAPYVERLAELEVTKGCKTEPLRFCPGNTVKRGQMAAFLVRAFDLAAADPAGFTDTAGSVHAADIDALAAAKVTVGCATDPLRYCPGAAVKRAQMATFLARALGLVTAS